MVAERLAERLVGQAQGRTHTRGGGGTDPEDYHAMMALHMRDNMPPSNPEQWKRVLQRLKSVAPPPRRRGPAASGEAVVGGVDDETCSVCLDGLHPLPASVALHQKRVAVCALPCGHAFHRPCITQCIKAGHWRCPNCRYDLVGDAPAGQALRTAG